MTDGPKSKSQFAPVDEQLDLLMRGAVDLVTEGLAQVRRALHGQASSSAAGLRHCLARLEELIKVQQDADEVGQLREALLAEIAGLDSLEQLREQPLFEAQYLEVSGRYPDLDDRRLIYEIIRRMINKVVTDLTETTQRNLNKLSPDSIDDIRNAGQRMVGFSDEIAEQHLSLKQFLNQHLYKHEQKLAMTRQVQVVLEELFATFMGDAQQMPAEFASAAESGDEANRARIVTDYIAGMTDRYAFAEHERILD